MFFLSSHFSFSKKKKKTLRSQPTQRPFTVYTVRFRTSSSRDAEPEDPQAGVLLCLIAENGDAVIRRIARHPDPLGADVADAAEACAAASAARDAAGFEAVAALERAASRSAADGGSEGAGKAAAPRDPAPLRPRFQRGSVDEVSFAAPDLGSPLAACVVSPHGGFGPNGSDKSTWRVDEVSVATTSQQQPPGGPAARFVFRGEAAGGSRGAIAAAAVPPGAVVVGAGDRASVLTPRQAEALRAVGLERYAWLKGRALANAAALAAAGTALLLAAAPGRPEAAALPFLAGGGAGLLYGWLLQAGVDAVGGSGGENAAAAFAEAEATATDGGSGGESESEQEDDDYDESSSVPAPHPQPSFLSRSLASAPLRALLVAGAGAALFSAANHATGGGGGAGAGVGGGIEAAATARGGGAAERLLPVRQLLAAAAGFSMYKVGLVATVAAADFSDAAAAEKERREREKEREGGVGGEERQHRVPSISSDDDEN